MTASLEPGRPRLGATIRATAVLLVLLLLFFSTPLSELGHTYYSPADLSQASELTRVDAGAGAKNSLLSDPAVQMQPWLMFNREALADGRLPLWNDWNAAGVPHLANYQSAVFSPFSVPFYVLEFRWALLLAAFAKLFCLGLFSYLYFRSIDLRQVPALVGAVAFAFSGLNVLLLGYPHSAVAATLPAALFCVERAIRARATGGGRNWVLALGLCLTCGLLAGHPEPFCFSLLVLAAYVVFRLTQEWRKHRLEPASRASVRPLALEFAAVGAIAAGIAAVQILPFLEYLSNSTVLGKRALGQPALAIGNWPLWFFPDGLGNPSTDRVLSFDLPFPNYEDVNTAYVGGLVLWLAVLGVFVSRRGLFLFFAAVAGLGILYGYDLFGLGRLLTQLPLMSGFPMNRSQILGTFGLSACAALCADRLLALPTPMSWRKLALIGMSALALAAAFWAGAEHLLAGALPEGSLDPGFRAFVTRHYLGIGLSFLVGVLAVLLGSWKRSTSSKAILGAVLVGTVFFESGFLLRDYNPTIEDRYFFPRTNSVENIRQAVQDRRLMVLRDRCLPPDTNLPYELRLASNYDALWVRHYDELYRRLFGSADNWRIAESVSETGLKVCGVEYLLTTESWPRVDTDFPRGELEEAGKVSGVLLFQSRVLRQTVIATRDRFQAIRLRVTHPRDHSSLTLRATLEDPSSGEVLAGEEIDLSRSDPIGSIEGPAPGQITRWVVFRFAPLASSRGKPYRLVLQVPDARPEAPLQLWIASSRPDPRADMEVNGRPMPGRILFDCSYNLEAFEPVLDTAKYALFRYKASPTRYYCVDRAKLARTEDEALDLVLAEDFDPVQAVVLSAPVPTPMIESSEPQTQSPVEVLEDVHSRARLRVDRASPGYLVLTRSHYPGWKAKVNGVIQPILRANVGLSAIYLGAGASDVEFYYDPSSVRVGLWISCASALSWLAWAAVSVWSKRKRPVHAPATGGS